MKKFVLLAVVAALFIASAGSGQAPRSKIFRKLMQQKLKSSKAMLEGLALSDFKKMRNSAEELLHISSTEDWFAYKTREYKLFSNEFRRAAEKISKKAKEKNLDGAALGYMELTMSCIRCHQYVRNVADVRFDADERRRQ